MAQFRNYLRVFKAFHGSRTVRAATPSSTPTNERISSLVEVRLEKRNLVG
jgi:hypothetical protein